MSEFDILLYRPLRPGKEYDPLIPKTVCRSEYAGDGMTDFSIEQMAEMVREYSWQMRKVAQLLKTGSLEENVAEIKEFIFSHFQYKADGIQQMLRSPACSWHVRKDGIDCKSYSILASCLLSEMGIAHYIRKIKQPGFEPEEWTHVYVIVPKDQTSNDLKKGYYTIDGTLEEDDEPDHLEKSDLVMMPHYRLNGAYGRMNGLAISAFGFNINNLSDLKSVLSHLDCFGGSSFDEAGLRKALTNIQKYYDDLIAEINEAAKLGDAEAFAGAVCEFQCSIELFPASVQGNRDKGWNSCTDGLIAVLLRATSWYKLIVGPAMNAWLNKYFTQGTASGSISLTNQGLEAKYGFRHMNTSPWKTVTKPRLMYTVKGSLSQVMAFEFTPYIADQTVPKASSFNASTFLSGLSTVLSSFDPNTSGPGSGDGTGIDINDIDPNASNQTQTAGGGILGWGIAIAAVGFLATSIGKSDADKTNKKTITA